MFRTIQAQSPFKGATLPIAESRRVFICAFAKIKKSGAGRFGCSNIVIHQNEFAHLCIVAGSPRPNASFPESLGLRSCVGIERRTCDAAAAWPESDAACL